MCAVNERQTNDVIQSAARVSGRGFFRNGIIALSLMPCLLLTTPVWADSAKVRIDGIEGKLLTNVKRSLSIAQNHEEPWTERRIRRLFRIGRSEARQALQPYGYYNPEIAATLQPPGNKDGDVWQVHYKIKPGPATTVKQLTLAVIGPGKAYPTLKQALQDSPLHAGGELHHSDYKATKSALAAAAYAAGFLDAQFEKSEIRVNPRNDTANIALVLDTGERYYFGPVHVDQDFLDPEFVRRLVSIKPGEPYNADRLVDMQLILSDTDYFSQVMIDAERNRARRALPIADWFYDLLWRPYPPATVLGGAGSVIPGELQIPVTVEVEPSKPQHYRISAGYGTDTGPRVGLGVKFRRINRQGHQFRTDLRISAVERTLHSSYDIPIKNVIRDRLSFIGELSNQKFGDITSNYAQIGVIRDTGWALGRNQPYLKFQFEHYDLKDGAGSRNARLLYPGYTWTLRRVDNALNTQKGVALHFDVRGTSKVLASSVDFLRLELRGGLIWPMTEHTRLVLRGELGALTSGDFADVPPSQRFFAGGGSSVRGYSYQGLSPTNSDGDNIGGRYLAVASFEADYRFHDNFYLATFFDVGNAANTFDMDLKRGVGIGLHWASPVGMIRLDVAHPLDDPDSNFRIHFNMGPVF